jgi:hypothetical protein
MAGKKSKEKQYVMTHENEKFKAEDLQYRL